jgi:glycosyltransferase involved in cell wall biosynthesis
MNYLLYINIARKEIYMEKIHVGPLPPPLGGISVFLYRLKKNNKTERVIDETMLNKWQFIKLLLQKDKHFIYHSPSFKRRLLVFLLCSLMGNKFTIVSHGDGLKDSYIRSNIFVKYSIKKMLKKATKIQTVNHNLANFLIENIKIEKCKIHIQHAFLPPPIEDEEKIIVTYSKELTDFIKEHSPIVIANASNIVWYQGYDLYGLDMCVQLIAELKKEYPDIGMIFALAKIGDEEYFKKLNKLIDDLKIKENIHFLTGQKELWPLFKQADVMVRPTNTDGDAVSIREALYFNCATVASDVCDRPEGTIVFKNRDQQEFYAKVIQCIK